MAPKTDPDVGCVIPEVGSWPVDPQEDVPVAENHLWIDGCFDFFHHGHAGVMLQARRLGDELIVGLHSDEAIRRNKGPTVMNLAERTAAIDACRFSTLCVPHAPYVTSLPWISHYGCKYVVHGDDITSDASGEDCYRFVKKAGRMKIVSRTPGISTTDLVGRMLLCSKSHFIKNLKELLAGNEGDGGEAKRKARGEEATKRIKEYAAAPNGTDPYVPVWTYQPKHRPMERRRSSIRATGETPQTHHDPGKGTFGSLVDGISPRPDQRIVYVDGGFDLFSSGHIAFLQAVVKAEDGIGKSSGWYNEEARAFRIAQTGSDYGPAYVVAGVHDDAVVNYYKGINYPIMNIFERGLCVVQCKYVHSVVFSAPYMPSKLFLSGLPAVTHQKKSHPDAVYHGPTAFMPSGSDPYADAKALGIFMETGKHDFQDVNAAQIVQRILDRRAEYEERQRKKGMKGVGEDAARKREMLEEEAERERKVREIEGQYGA